jgi:hypothetical protein
VTHRIRFALLIFVGIGFWLFPPHSQAQTDSSRDRIMQRFSPYRAGSPQVEGISPGMTLNSSNASAAAAVLPPEILSYVAAGDVSISIQETTDLPLRQAFIDATLQSYEGVVVGEEELQNYVSGLPFPLLEPQDSQAGLKAVWNLRYRDQGDTSQMWAINALLNASGTVERSSRFAFMSLYGMHRIDPAKNVAAWENQGVYTKRYSQMLAPSDAEGNQLIGVTYDNDALPQDQWAYDPKSRRTRKIVYNPYVSPEQGVLLIEDRSGFLGYIADYDWTYVEEKVVLTPGPIKADKPTWGGKGNWYFVDPWELRQAVVVEGKPKNGHPMYSRRVLYMDVQTALPLYALTYDHDGNHKRTFFLIPRHPEYDPWDNKEWFAQIAAQGSIDYQLERGNTFEIYKILHNRPMNPNKFSVMALMLSGK